MSCCCKLFCSCAPHNFGTDECPIYEKTVEYITQDFIVATDGSTYPSKQWINLRAGQTFLVDCKGDITGRIQPNTQDPKNLPKDDMLIGSPKVYAGSSQTPAHIRLSGMYGSYTSVSHDFVISPILDPSDRSLSTSLHLTSFSTPDTDDIIGLIPYSYNLAANSTVDSIHRYAVDRSMEKCHSLMSGYYSESDFPAPPSGVGDEVLAFPLGYFDDQWKDIELAPEPTTSADWGTIPLSYPLMRWQSSPSGSISVYWVDPRYSRFNLNTGAVTTDTPNETFLGSSSAGWVKAKFYWWNSGTSTVDSGESGFYFKSYSTDGRNPFPIPKIELFIEVGPGLYGILGIWRATDAQIASAVDVELNYLPSRFRPWAAGSQPTKPYFYTTALIPGVISPPPVWSNTENYVYKSKTYPSGGYTVYPYTGTRADEETFEIEALVWFKAKVNGAEVRDRDGNDKLSGWTHFNYGDGDQDICVIFVPFDSDHVVIYESDGAGSFRRIFVDIVDLPLLSVYGLTTAYRAYGAIGHKNERNHNGILDFNTMQIRFGAYDPYHDSSYERWRQFGVKRPASKADYDAYVAAGILAGKTLYELVPPPYNTGTIVHPKDIFLFADHLWARLSNSSSDSAQLPIDLKLVGSTITDASVDLPKIAKQMYLQNSGWVDESDDKTSIKGSYIAKFSLSDINQKDGCVLMGRYMGDIGTLVVKVMSDDLTTYGPQYYPEYNGIWDYPGAYPSLPMDPKKNQFRTFSCPIDVDSFDAAPSDLYVYVEAQNPLSQLILWVQ